MTLVHTITRQKVAILAVKSGRRPVTYTIAIATSVAFRTARSACTRKELLEDLQVGTKELNWTKAVERSLLEARSANYAIGSSLLGRWFKEL